jgi:hypothetical protein
LSGCATADETRLYRAVAAAEQAKALPRAVAQARKLPPYPPQCRQKERSGVSAADTLAAALIKTDGALSRANEKLGACAQWYGRLAQSVVDAAR